MKIELHCQSFEKYADMKFHENPLKGVEDEMFPADTRTDTTKLIVTFRSSSNEAKNISKFRCVGKTVTNLN
jgi:hypothetical protein